FAHAPPASDISPLSLHDALPIWWRSAGLSSLSVSRISDADRIDAAWVSMRWTLSPRNGSRFRRSASAATASFWSCQARCSARTRSEEHTSELQSRENLVCRLLLE